MALGGAGLGSSPPRSRGPPCQSGQPSADPGRSLSSPDAIPALLPPPPGRSTSSSALIPVSNDSRTLGAFRLGGRLKSRSFGTNSSGRPCPPDRLSAQARGPAAGVRSVGRSCARADFGGSAASSESGQPRPTTTPAVGRALVTANSARLASAIAARGNLSSDATNSGHPRPDLAAIQCVPSARQKPAGSMPPAARLPAYGEALTSRERAMASHPRREGVQASSRPDSTARPSGRKGRRLPPPTQRSRQLGHAARVLGVRPAETSAATEKPMHRRAERVPIAAAAPGRRTARHRR